jgi:hypothetical protein
MGLKSPRENLRDKTMGAPGLAFETWDPSRKCPGRSALTQETTGGLKPGRYRIKPRTSEAAEKRLLLKGAGFSLAAASISPGARVLTRANARFIKYPGFSPGGYFSL